MRTATPASTKQNKYLDFCVLIKKSFCLEIKFYRVKNKIENIFKMS